jgi:hypothetical protein
MYWRPENWGSVTGEVYIFLFIIAFLLAVGPAHFVPIGRQRYLTLGIKQPRCDAEHPLHPMGRLGDPQSRSGLCGEEKNLLPLLGVESRFHSHPARSLATFPTELYRLLKERSHMFLTPTGTRTHDPSIRVVLVRVLDRAVAVMIISSIEHKFQSTFTQFYWC